MMDEDEYTLRFIREFVKHIPDLDLKTALYLADVGFNGPALAGEIDPEDDARNEAEEWKYAA